MLEILAKLNKAARLRTISNKSIIKALKHNLGIGFLLIAALLTITATIHVFAVGEVFVANNLAFDSGAGAVKSSKFVDIDNDQDDDLFLVNSGKNRLFINDGRGNFNEAQNSGVGENGLSQAVTFGDYDNDGYSDFFVSNFGGKGNLYRNNQNGTFNKIQFDNNNAFSTSTSWFNLNNDSFLDLLVMNSYGVNALYKNIGDGSFIKLEDATIIDDSGRPSAIRSSDINNDGKLDFLILNNGQNFLYLNDGYGTLTKIQNDPVVDQSANSLGGGFGDIDNDGDFDLFVANYNEASKLYLNNGNGTFIEVVDWPGANLIKPSHDGKFADYDNDADLDLFVINSNGEENSLYINDGNGVFELEESATFDAYLSLSADNKTSPASLSFSDVENDGDLDLFVSDSFGTNALLKNSGNQNNWLNLKLNGTFSNQSAIGAKVKVEFLAGESRISQIRELSSDHGDSDTLHFGLADAEAVKKVTINWPSGITQVLRNINPNQLLNAEEEDNTLIGNNLLLNGDMESAEPGWIPWGTPAINERIVSPEGNTTVAHIASSGGGIQQLGISVLPGNSYRLSFDLKMASGSLLPKLNILKNANYNKHADFYDNNLSLSWRNYGQWKKYSRVVTIPADYNPATNDFRLSLVASSSAGQAEAWIDNVELIEIDNPNLVYDGEMQLKQLWLLWGTPALNEKIYDRNLRSQVSHIRTNDLGSSGGIRQDNIRVLPGHSYEFSFDLKMNSGYLMPYLNILRNANYNKQADFSGNVIRLFARDYGNWTHYSRIVTIPLDFNPDANSLRLSLIARNQNAFSEAWIDNVKLVEVFLD